MWAGTTALAAPSISTSTTKVVAGGALVATVVHGPGNVTDWVGLYPVGASFDYPLGSEWEYLNGTQKLPATGARANQSAGDARIQNPRVARTSVVARSPDASRGSYGVPAAQCILALFLSRQTITVAPSGEFPG